MAVEIDFLPVGDGARSGDAITLRYGDAQAGYRVMAVDGGTQASGEALVKHIRGVYGTNKVADVVNTHPDGDHASGLSVVLTELDVGRLWMHRPWDYAEDIRHLFQDGRITDESLERRIREALQSAHDLEQVAIKRKVPIIEPYRGANIGPFLVLSPHKDWYLKELVPNFRGTPEAKGAAEGIAALAKILMEKAKEGVAWVKETLAIETLKDDGETSAQNESSVVMCASFDGNKVLLTGDAGIQALTRSARYAAGIGLRLDDLWMVQVPHHGSRNNVSPAILDKIKGQYAIASAAEADDLHPRRVVTNALKRRGAQVYATKGKGIRQQYGMVYRDGWTAAAEIPFYDQVEA